MYVLQLIVIVFHVGKLFIWLKTKKVLSPPPPEITIRELNPSTRKNNKTKIHFAWKKNIIKGFFHRYMSLQERR